ncbi:hypothetical protein SCALM49S_03403 [Streptomyces californicus]
MFPPVSVSVSRRSRRPFSGAGATLRSSLPASSSASSSRTRRHPAYGDGDPPFGVLGGPPAAGRAPGVLEPEVRAGRLAAPRVRICSSAADTEHWSRATRLSTRASSSSSGEL